MKKSKKNLQKKIDHKGCTDQKFNLTRRDLVRLGALAGGGFLLPTVTPYAAFAKGPNVDVPFLVFDLVGGAGLPANFLVGQKGGPEDLCAKYEQHGWNPRASDSLDRTFGIPMSKKNSQMLVGLKETLPASLQNEKTNKNFKMTSICNFSLDDTDTNKASALSLISKVGLIGENLKSGIGQQASRSGGNAEGLITSPKFQPKFIGSKDDVLNMTSLGADFTSLSSSIKSQIFERLNSYGKKAPGLQKGYKDLSLFGKLHLIGDPVRDEYIQNLYQIDQDSSDEEAYIQAAIAYNVLNGYSGPGAITIDDCDYHDSTQITGDNKDLQIGRAIGRAVHMAYHLKKPLFFQVITDGGVYASSDSFDRAWLGDENLHSLTIMGYFNPNEEVEIEKLQLGHYTSNGELEIETNVGGSSEDMVRAVAANYLNIQGKLGRFQDFTGIRGLSVKELEALVSLGTKK